MNLSDITKINFGSAGIVAVYNGGIKLWPSGTGESNKVMKFTIVSGDTLNNTDISAYTADNRLITPVTKDATGWTYPYEVGYIGGFRNSANLLTFEGFPQAVKIKRGQELFSYCTNCTDISTTNLDVSECTNSTAMLYRCGVLKTLDLSNWDTSKITNMFKMFEGCFKLTSLNLSNFNTSQVTNMGNMFCGCESLASLDVSNFDTSQVTNMEYMFEDCGSLTSLNLSNFNTSQVTKMYFMFQKCYGLVTLDLSNWDTSKVTGISGMFNNCSALKTVEMANCTQETRDKIGAALDAAGLTSVEITVNGVPV